MISPLRIATQLLTLGLTSACLCLIMACSIEPGEVATAVKQDAATQEAVEQDAVIEKDRHAEDAGQVAAIGEIEAADPVEVAPPTTAEELLARIASGVERDQPGELSAGETDKAVALLRKRYPLVSIRDRLSFQSRDPIVPPKKPGLSRWERAPEDFYSNRPGSLKVLHSDEVEAFINRSGFGFDRGPFPNPYDLKLDGEYADLLMSRPVDSRLLGEAVVELPTYVEPTDRENEIAAIWSLTNGMPNDQLTLVFHVLTNREFASTNSTGFVQDLDNVAGFQAHRIRHQKDWDGSLRIWDKKKLAERYPGIKWDVTWRVNRLQLVSLLIHPTPRIYVSAKLPNMEELKGANAETRALDDFETTGLAKLSEGQEEFTIATPNRIVMLGAIRAGNNCLHCHDVKQDDLLGAFSYELLREPRLDLKPLTF